MNDRFSLVAFHLILALMAAPEIACAAESYDNCTGFITSIPTVITTQGTWCLKSDLTTAMTSGNAVTINVNNVTIDCNDFKLGGLAAGVGTSTSGIAAVNRLNATVRHCNVRGFIQGINFSGSGGGHLIEDNRFDGNTGTGISVGGDGSVVRRNRVFDSGGSTLTSQGNGIVTFNSVDVLDNTVSGVMATVGGSGAAVGIYTLSNVNGRVIGNGVRGLVPDGGGVGYGIFNSSSSRLSIRDNDIVGDGGATSVGVHCTDSGSHARGNLTINFTLGLEFCNDDGGNVSTP